jgi:hypothetical protein
MRSTDHDRWRHDQVAKARLRSAALLSLLATACGSQGSTPSSTVSAAAYDHSCASVADCTPVFEGYANCCATGCPNTAITVSALATYDKALHAAQLVSCGGSMICRGLGPDPSGCQGRVACRDGQCVLDEAPADGAAD